MSKFRELRAQRREEVSMQWQLFCAMFDGEIVTPGMGEVQKDTLRTVMWASWRACAYTNGIISEDVKDGQSTPSDQGLSGTVTG